MALSARTIEEMRVGAENVARYERLRTLEILQKRGHVRIDQDAVWVGESKFLMEEGGFFPTPLQMANVAFAIEGRQYLK